MANIQLKRILAQDKDLQLIQDNVQSAINALSASPYQGGNLLTAVDVGTSPTVINHGLGRTPQMWTLADQDTSANVWRTAWTSTTITLQASSACTIAMWIN